jgi:hypothetical protein
MATTNNPIDSSLSLPTLAALQRRRRQLIAFQAWQRSPQASVPLAEEEPLPTPTAQRMGKALNASPQGLTRFQIRELLHGHKNSKLQKCAFTTVSTFGGHSSGLSALTALSAHNFFTARRLEAANTQQFGDKRKRG